MYKGITFDQQNIMKNKLSFQSTCIYYVAMKVAHSRGRGNSMNAATGDS